MGRPAAAPAGRRGPGAAIGAAVLAHLLWAASTSAERNPSLADIELQVATAQQLAERGQFDAALAKLEAVVRSTVHPGVRLLTAKLCFEHGRWRRSRQHFEALARGEMTGSAEVWFSLGVIAERGDGDAAAAAAHYRKAVDRDPDHAAALANLGTLLANSGRDSTAELDAALALVTRAVAADPSDTLARRNQRLIRRQKVELRKRAELTAEAGRTETGHGKAKYTGQGTPESEPTVTPADVCATVSPIPREAAAGLSFKRFYKEYASAGRPVIITGGLPPSLAAWGIEAVERRCGDAVVPLRTPAAGSWAGLAPSRNATLAEFFRELRGRAPTAVGGDARRLPYLFDYSLSACGLEPPDVPTFFAHDFLQRVPPSKVGPSSFRDYWPSLFVGPAGTASELHVDGWCANFWSALIRGRKRWTVFRKADTSRLYKNHLSGTFDVNMSAFRREAPPGVLCLGGVHAARFPLVRGAAALQAEMTAGEMLFVPAMSPHWVENVARHADEQISVGLAGNYVDGTNLACAAKALKAIGVDNADAKALGAELGSVAFDATMNLDDAARWVPWDAYKGQWDAHL